jgi:hypothetical protein
VSIWLRVHFACEAAGYLVQDGYCRGGFGLSGRALGGV